MNLDKIEIMRIGEQEVEIHVVLDGKTIKQVNSFVYLGRTVCEDGGSSKETKRREQAGAAGRHYVGQKTEEINKSKSVGSMRGSSLYIRVGNTGTDRDS